MLFLLHLFFAASDCSERSTDSMVCRLFRNIEDIQKLSELGVLFLLFEMGLELSLDRLKASMYTSWCQHISVHHITAD